MPSVPSAGFAGKPATSAESMVAPGGSETFMNGCARFRSHNETSVSIRPSVVTSVVATARSAMAASTAASGKRVTFSASAGTPDADR